MNTEHTDEPNLTNLGAIDATLQKQLRELFLLDEEIAEKKDAHIKPLQQAKSKIKQNLKGDTGLEITDINLYYKLFQRQEKAKLLDEEDRNRILDNLRTMHRALANGDMLDFIDVLDHVSAAEKADAAERKAESEAVH